DDYPWSSHACYLGRQKIPWLNTAWVLSQFNDNLDIARRTYGEFVLEGLSEGHRKEFHGGSFEGRILGTDRFVEQALMQAEQILDRPVKIDMILEAVSEYYGLQREDLSALGRHQPLAEARAVAAWLVKRYPQLQLKGLGVKLHRDLSGLSQGARRIEERAKSDKRLKDTLEQLVERVDKSVSQA
ncbi:MAG: transposase, partial [Deltaproteobacteria bacterium]|nr:transposase [Deltaproteobacteria bacterium]